MTEDLLAGDSLLGRRRQVSTCWDVVIAAFGSSAVKLLFNQIKIYFSVVHRKTDEKRLRLRGAGSGPVSPDLHPVRNNHTAREARGEDSPHRGADMTGRYVAVIKKQVLRSARTHIL